MEKVIVNCETGVQEVVPLTAEEIAELEAAAAKAEQERQAAEAEAEAKETARAEILTKLGLSAEELSTLLS